MKCSHGLAYEVKCSMCYSEAMARVIAAPKTAGVKTEPPKAPVCYDSKELQIVVDSVQRLS